MCLVVGSQRFAGICRLHPQNKFSDRPYQAIHKWHPLWSCSSCDHPWLRLHVPLSPSLFISSRTVRLTQKIRNNKIMELQNHIDTLSPNSMQTWPYSMTQCLLYGGNILILEEIAVRHLQGGIQLTSATLWTSHKHTSLTLSNVVWIWEERFFF